MSILSVKNLEKKFGDLTVLKDISFDINDGEIISIIGSSGSGKSTLLRCMNQLETITSGTITIDGKTLVETKNGTPVYAGKDVLKEILMETGFVFQNFNLFPHYSVLRNVMEAPVCVAGVPKKQAEEKAIRVKCAVEAYHCPVDETELCIIIGNLFDNAIEAVKDLPDEQRQIDFSIQNPNGIFRIEMSNPYEDERRKVEHHYLTTKKENTEMHGLGLMSVQKIVEKYDGLMEISDTDNVFKVIVIFFVRGND